MSPPRPHPKQCQVSRCGVTTNDGVFSPWKGQRPLYVVPAFFRLTVSPTTSTTESLFFTSAATPTAKRRLLVLDMTVGLSSLDKPCGDEVSAQNPILSTLLSIPSGGIMDSRGAT